MPRLHRKWEACLTQVTDSQDYFTQLSAFVGQRDVARWEELAKRMEEQRDNNVKVMDSMDVKEGQGMFSHNSSEALVS